jgi:site-specific DNA-methyltransferase (adenine-specific)
MNEFNVLEVELDRVKVHQTVSQFCLEKVILGLKLTMSMFGLLEPLRVVVRGDYYLVVDGVSRYRAALELGWEKIMVMVLDLTDEEISNQHVLRNYRVRRSISELIHHSEIILGILGLSQGKKRETIGDIESDEEISLAGNDRFQIACQILGSEVSASTLRKLISVNDFVMNGDEKVKNLGIMEKLDSGVIKPHQAYNAMKNFIAQSEQRGQNELTETLDVIRGGNYELYRKSCEDLSDVTDNSVQCVITSPPYFQQRDYTRSEFIQNQLGLEKTPDEYIEKLVNIHRGVFNKLKDTGSLFIVISDSYDKGCDLLVVEKLIIKMVESGWSFIQKWYWVKENPKPQNNIKRLLPNYEYVLHFVKDVKKYYWREFIHWVEGEFSLKPSSKQRELGKPRDVQSWTLAKPIIRFKSFLDGQHVQRVIEANGFRWDELKEIDSNYRHQAPFPYYMALLPMLMTTKVGDTVLDIFNGTGTTTAVGLQLGRKVIGYDLDVENFRFAQKRMEMVNQNLPDIQEVYEFEDEYMVERPMLINNAA